MRTRSDSFPEASEEGYTYQNKKKDVVQRVKRTTNGLKCLEHFIKVQNLELSETEKTQ